MHFIDEFVEPLDLDFLSAQTYPCNDMLHTCTTVCMYVCGEPCGSGILFS